MNKKHVLLLGLCMMFMLVITSGVMAQAEPTHLKIGYSTWVGYGPLFIAQEKGYLAEQGLDVEFVKVEDPKDRFTALAGSQLDGLVTTLDTMSQYWNAETPYRAILGLDESSGGDGIVVNSSIASVEDLKGKKIGVNVGSVSQFFLEYVLQQHNMSDSDVELVKMKQGDVPAALASSQIDAGVTWEPHLSKSVDNGATLLVSSKETPGLIVDILVLRDAVLTDHPEVGAGLVAAWYEAVDYENANPDDGAAIMAKGLGGFYETGDDIKADLAGVTLFDEARNQEFFGSTDAGSATATLQFAIDFYTSLGIITTPVDTANLLDASYVLPEGMMPEATPEETATLGIVRVELGPDFPKGCDPKSFTCFHPPAGSAILAVILQNDPKDSGIDPLDKRIYVLDGDGNRSNIDTAGLLDGEHVELFAVKDTATDFTLYWPDQPAIKLEVNQ